MKMKLPQFKVGDVIKFHAPNVNEEEDIGVIIQEVKYHVGMDDWGWEVWFFVMERELVIYEHEMILISRMQDEQKEKDQRT